MANNVSLDDLAGRIMGGCRLSRRVGKGAMGVVYLANQMDLGREVALKILDPKFSRDPTYIERFEMEARAAAQLNHPNIVKVFDFGSEDGLFFIVNEYVDGGTVQNIIEARAPLPPEEAVGYAIQVARGLEASGEANIVHRDIKPDNLMLTRDGVLKIADFGLAQNMIPETVASDIGLIMGTPFYMSPEQAKGLNMDSRSDIYSLGVSMYCMVIGDVPFDADSVVGVLLKQISAERPDPCAVKPALPSVLGSLIMRMMDRNPANRPRNPTELLNELLAVQEILRPAAPPTMAEVSGKAGVDRTRFPLLARDRLERLTRIEAKDDLLERLRKGVREEGGVTIEWDEVLPANTAVELRFTENNGSLRSGIGLVRWSEGNRMGISFVRIQQVPRDGLGEPEPPAIDALTATPLHQRLLRLIYSKAGQVATMPQLTSWLGVGWKMAEETVRTFEAASLIARREDDRLEFRWPEEESLQREIVVWMERNGLQ